MANSVLENWLASADRALKLVLWLQLPRHRLSGLLVHLYAAPWLAALAVFGSSACMLLLSAKSSNEVTRMALVSLWPILVVAAYVLARCLPQLTAALAVLIPGTMTITPSVGAWALPHYAEDPEATHYLATGDLALFLKGALACLCLSAISFGLQAVAKLPRSRRWPLRWAMALTILGSGLVGLEILRSALNLAPGLRMPWTRVLMSFMSEPGWPYAIVLWLWTNTTYLLARYDAQLLPYLLRRAGNVWAPDELSINETYLVDHLLHELVEQWQTSGVRESGRRGKKRRPPKRDH